jgi:hypothetical protein
MEPDPAALENGCCCVACSHRRRYFLIICFLTDFFHGDDMRAGDRWNSDLQNTMSRFSATKMKNLRSQASLYFAMDIDVAAFRFGKR